MRDYYEGSAGRMWVHGEMLYEGKAYPFRYTKEGTLRDMIHNIETRFICGSKVLWIEEGFIPDNTERWSGWTMKEPDEFTELHVEKSDE